MKKSFIEANSLVWLTEHRDLGSVVTSLPDLDELKFIDLERYPEWFSEAATQCFLSASPGHPVIFYQTDRLTSGRRISKAHLLMNVAHSLNTFQLVWHKIVLRRNPGKTDLRRPGYSHLLCFGDKKVRPGKPTPDVMHSGGVLYPNGMGITAATAALQCAKRHGSMVCDPFCGRGTVVAMAERLGFTAAVGVDIDPQQIAAAKQLRLSKGAIKREKLNESN